MKHSKQLRGSLKSQWAFIGAILLALGASTAWAAGLPEGGDAANDDGSITDVYYENDTRFRGDDDTGNNVGLSKFRNTLQVEADRKLGSSGWEFHGVFRGTYDGVYDLNKGEYGKNAGGAISMQSTDPAGIFGTPDAQGHILTPFGTGPVTQALVAGPPFSLGGNAFVNSYPNNPNVGLRVLGDRWHGVDGGVAFAVPVRPCNTDSRGCKDFGGYGDQDKNELASPEFNDRLDFIREAYVKKTFELADNKQLFVKVGRQQVVWGRTDLFRVLDVINPVDYSRNNIYDELQDIRIPMFIAQAEYRMGGSDWLQEQNLQVVWNFDKFRPNNLGQCGTANVILDAGCLFRGLNNLWENGGTVANFANPAFLPPGTFLATNFGPHQIGLNKVDLPNWSLDNTQLGAKFEGVTKGGVNFSLNALTYRSQLPSLHGGKRAVNSFGPSPFNPAFREYNPYLISFDMVYPRVNLVGGSMDFQWNAAKSAVRVEAAYTSGEEFANSNKEKLFSRNHVFRSVIGIDRPTFIPFISDTRTVLFSGQLFYQHIFDHERDQNTLGKTGMVDWEDNFIGTLLIKAFLKNDRLSPQVIFAHDFNAESWVAAPQVEWIASDKLKFTVGANVKWGNDESKYKVDDCRSCNPFAPFTAPAGDANPLQSFSRGLSGLEPLGRFRAGPIGAAVKEDEIYFNMRYKF
jgi:Protein of unknown function (DUF1302)